MNMSMKPNNLLILGVLGVGAYWFLTRKANAATVPSYQPAVVQRQQTGTVAQNKPSFDLRGGVLAGLDYFLNNPAPGLPAILGGSSVDAVPVNTPSGYLPDTSTSWAADEYGEGLF